MNPPNTSGEIPRSYLWTKKYVIGTPDSLMPSDKTFDITFHDFAENDELQERLGLLPLKSIGADRRFFEGRPMDLLVAENIGRYASYLTSFRGDDSFSYQGREYLVKNGLVRIQVKDDVLRQELIPKHKQL